MTDKTGKPVAGWTDREILVCLLNVIESCDVKLDYNTVSYPAGRNANGFRQKINALKRELQPEFEAIKASDSIDSTPKKKTTNPSTSKSSTPRKRKIARNDDEGEGTPKKRGRAKKNASPEVKAETTVKDEPVGEAESIEHGAESSVELEV